LDNVPSSLNDVRAFAKPLESNAGFLLDIEGQKVVALRFPGSIVKQISGQEVGAPAGIVAKLKAKLGLTKDVERWFVATGVDNPLLKQTDRFASLVVGGLTKATGTVIVKSELAIAASVPINTINGASSQPNLHKNETQPNTQASNPNA